MFHPYPSKTKGILHQQHTEACKKVEFVKAHLKYLCEKSLNKNGLNILDCQTEEVASTILTEEIISRNEKPLEDFIFTFINRTENPDLIHAMAQFLLLFVGDAAMSSVLPKRYHEHT